MPISDIKTFIKQLVLLVSLYELLMSFRSSRKRPLSIVLPWGRLRERILVSDQLWLRPLFRIPEVVAYESFNCMHLQAEITIKVGD